MSKIEDFHVFIGTEDATIALTDKYGDKKTFKVGKAFSINQILEEEAKILPDWKKKLNESEKEKELLKVQNQKLEEKNTIMLSELLVLSHELYGAGTDTELPEVPVD